MAGVKGVGGVSDSDSICALGGVRDSGLAPVVKNSQKRGEKGDESGKASQGDLTLHWGARDCRKGDSKDSNGVASPALNIVSRTEDEGLFFDSGRYLKNPALAA